MSVSYPVPSPRQPAAEASSLSSSRAPVFVVGCSRGGTTLLLSILAQQPGFIGFPESNILYHLPGDIDFRRFGYLMGRSRLPAYALHRLMNRAGITTRFERTSFEGFLRAVGRLDLMALVPESTWQLSDVFAAFCRVMDSLADGRRWIEKSPQNIFCLDFIDRFVPGALVLHVVRDGRANVASLMSAAAKHQAFSVRFGGPLGLEKAVTYWNSALKASWRYRGCPRHAVVRYEDLAADPRRALRPVERLLGISIADASLRYDLRGIAGEEEIWKLREGQAIRPAESKFESVLTPAQQQFAAAHLLEADRYFPRALADEMGKPCGCGPAGG